MDNAMTVKIGSLTFDHATYDGQGDVLYLRVGERQAADDSEETPEGHVLRFDAHGEIIGLTIINAKWLLERDGALNVTIPEHVAVSPDALTPALQTA
ncbi:MAG TPA: DUF2283 domain-containing protein [Solirubrobacteraceae bacterium]|nr:DUF2283 domain-containing protein [Solirubrobacteraceae bacterium]